MKKNWHHLLLILITIIATGLLTRVAVFFPTEEEIAGPNLRKPPQKNVELVSQDELLGIKVPWINPDQWDAPPGVPSQLFIPRMWLYFPEKNEAELIQGSLEIDGIPINWLEKHRINWRIPKIAFIDSDRDGFSNLYEYKKNTNPADSKDHPDYAELLRLKDYEIIPFRLRFQAVNKLDGQDVFQINLMDENTRFPRTLRAFNRRLKERLLTPEAAKQVSEKDRVFQNFIIQEFRPKREMQFNQSTNLTEEVDVSELDIVDERIGTPITLIINKIIVSPDSNTVLVALLPNKIKSEIRVRQGEDFNFMDGTYRLIRISADQAIIRELSTNREIIVPSFENKDLELVPIESSSTGLE